MNEAKITHFRQTDSVRFGGNAKRNDYRAYTAQAVTESQMPTPVSTPHPLFDTDSSRLALRPMLTYRFERANGGNIQ